MAVRRGIATVAAVALLATTTLAGAAEITVLATTAMKSALDALIRLGRVVAASRADIAGVRIGVAVRKGAPRPDISSADALKRALLAAKSVAFVDPASGGASGAHLVPMFERLGVAAQVNAKARLARGGPDGMVSAIVAAGEAEIGLQQISEIMSVDGVDLVGPLPDELQSVTVYSAGLLAKAALPDAAQALILFLRTPEAVVVLRAKGLEP